MSGPMKNILFKIHAGLFVLVIMTLWLSSGCSVHRVTVRKEKGHRVEYGLASWYGEDFHGKLTANGEVYDMYKLSAAHKTLPLGTRVRVTNRKNGKSAVVRINDRGPFVRGRIIDLSYAGARALGMADDGVVPVRVEILKLGDNRYVSSEGGEAAAAPMAYTVQVGSFLQKENALVLVRSLKGTYDTVFIREWNDRQQTFYRVRVGKYASEEDAQKLCRRLSEQNYSAYVTAE